MKKITTFILSFFTASAFASLAPDQSMSAIEHLSEVNKEWLINSDYAPKEYISFSNDQQRIRYHLLNVESVLRSKNTEHLSQDQLKNRLKMLDVLYQYALDMQFPVNTYHPHRQPYFIDVYGTHCAVGYLVAKSGHGEISKAISEKQNYAYVREIESQELMQWSIDYGFSLDELAWIQPEYTHQTPYYPVGSGTNGRVVAIERFSAADLYIAGDFTLLGDIPCLNVAVYDGNQLSCLGVGLEGKIVDLKISGNNIVYVAGKFEDEGGVTYPLAKYQDDEWSYISIPNRENAEATAISVISTAVFVAIETEDYGVEVFNTGPDGWSKIASFNGTVYAIDNQYYGGKFSQVSLLVHEDVVTVQTNNVVNINHNSSVWDVFDAHIPDTVFSLLRVGSNVYVGGSASPESGSRVLLSRILNQVAQPLITISEEHHGDVAIYDMAMDISTSEVILGGKLQFAANNILYNAGKNAFKYILSTGHFYGIASFNEPVYTIYNNSNDQNLFLGGDFTTGSGGQLFHLAQKISTLHLNDLVLNNQFILSPNPTTSEIRISGIEGNETQVEIIDAQGKVIIPRQVYSQSINVESVQQGIYFANVIRNDNAVAVMRFVKM